jgi:hypothetical protein
MKLSMFAWVAGYLPIPVAYGASDNPILFGGRMQREFRMAFRKLEFSGT